MGRGAPTGELETFTAPGLPSPAMPISRPSPPRRGTIIIPFALLLCAAVAVGAWAGREPEFEGRPLKLWLQDFESNAVYAQEQAARAIREIGPQALPLLVQHLEATDSALKLKMVGWMEKQSILKVSFTPALSRQRRGIRGCRALGPLARPAIPKLIPFLNGPLGYEAAYSLAVIDPAGIFPLTEVTDADPFMASINRAAPATPRPLASFESK